MKILIPVLAMILLVPFVICSCFVQQAKSMKFDIDELKKVRGYVIILPYWILIVTQEEW